MEQITPGIYRHYSGREYEVILLATHSQSNEPLVVYRAMYGEFKVWVKPLEEWLLPVQVDGVEKTRFVRVESKPHEK